MTDKQPVNDVLKDWGAQVDKTLPSVPPRADLIHPRISRPVETTAPVSWGKWAGALAAAVLVMFWVLPRPESLQAKESFTGFVQLYTEISRMFPQQSVWMSGTDSNEDMDVKPLDAHVSGNRLALRIEVQSQAKDGKWNEVWRRDIVTTETAWVDTASTEHPQEKLSVWTHALSKGVWVLESYLDLPQPYNISSREQVMFTVTDTGPSVNEIMLRPGMRMVQTLVEVGAGGQGA